MEIKGKATDAIMNALNETFFFKRVLERMLKNRYLTQPGEIFTTTLETITRGVEILKICNPPVSCYNPNVAQTVGAR